MKCKEKNAEYLNSLFVLLRKREGITLSNDKRHFSDTELRLLAEVLSAQYKGKRLISTQLAKLLGITRSAISQIVNKLEKEGVVRRVADDVDRKIAYIEITENTLATYEKDIQACLVFIGNVVEKYGEEKFNTMCELFNEFVDLVEVEKEKIVCKK